MSAWLTGLTVSYCWRPYDKAICHVLNPANRKFFSMKKPNSILAS
jgi:hypothetical protein